MANTRRLLIVVVGLVAVGAVLWWIRAPRLPIGTRSLGGPAARGGELIASTRSEPSTYNRYAPDGASAATELVTLLTHARLVRVNRATDDLEPWLAERWTASDDGLSYTLTLRPNVLFSDGVPLSSADVLFSLRAAYDPKLKSPLQAGVQVGGKPVEASAPDDRTVIVRFPVPFAPGLRLLDNLPILPKHKLEAALNAGTLADEWTPAKPLSDIAGLGPFVLTEHVSGQRLVFTRNPNYFRHDDKGAQLPYVDKLTLLVIPDQNTEALRLQAGEIDLMSNGEIRPQDYAAFKGLSDQGRLRLINVGTGLDPDFLWFNLTSRRQQASKAPWIFRREFRQAISYAIDRQAIANGVYLGTAVPIYGPVSPGNTKWYSSSAPTYPKDVGRARQLLTSIGLVDRNGDGQLEDHTGGPVRFSIVTQAGHIRGRAASAIQEQLRQVGITVDLVALEPRGIFQRWSTGDYDSIYFGLQASSTDPALNPDFWFSSGDSHWWNPSQPAPETAWERRIDDLMREQASAPDLAARQRAFAEVQRIMGEELPAIYFVASRVTIATTPRVRNAKPAPQLPQLLWSADILAAAAPPR